MNNYTIVTVLLLNLISQCTVFSLIYLLIPEKGPQLQWTQYSGRGSTVSYSWAQLTCRPRRRQSLKTQVRPHSFSLRWYRSFWAAEPDVNEICPETLKSVDLFGIHRPWPQSHHHHHLVIGTYTVCLFPAVNSGSHEAPWSLILWMWPHHVHRHKPVHIYKVLACPPLL